MMEVDEDDNEAVEDVAVTPPERPQRPALSPARLNLASSLKKLKLGLVKAMGPEPTPSEFKPLRCVHSRLVVYEFTYLYMHQCLLFALADNPSPQSRKYISSVHL